MIYCPVPQSYSGIFLHDDDDIEYYDDDEPYSRFSDNAIPQQFEIPSSETITKYPGMSVGYSDRKVGK